MSSRTSSNKDDLGKTKRKSEGPDKQKHAVKTEKPRETNTAGKPGNRSEKKVASVAHQITGSTKNRASISSSVESKPNLTRSSEKSSSKPSKSRRDTRKGSSPLRNRRRSPLPSKRHRKSSSRIRHSSSAVSRTPRFTRKRIASPDRRRPRYRFSRRFHRRIRTPSPPKRKDRSKRSPPRDQKSRPSPTNKRKESVQSTSRDNKNPDSASIDGPPASSVPVTPSNPVYKQTFITESGQHVSVTNYNNNFYFGNFENTNGPNAMTNHFASQQAGMMMVQGILRGLGATQKPQANIATMPSMINVKSISTQATSTVAVRRTQQEDIL